MTDAWNTDSPDDAAPSVSWQEFVLQAIPVTPDMKLAERRGRPVQTGDDLATRPPAAEPPPDERQPPAAPAA